MIKKATNFLIQRKNKTKRKPGSSPSHLEFQYECYKILILQGNFELLLTVRHRGILTKTKKGKDTTTKHQKAKTKQKERKKKNNIIEKQNLLTH